MQETLYFTYLVQRGVRDSEGSPIGQVIDLVVSYGDLFPRITGLVVQPRRGRPQGASLQERLFIPLEHVQDLSSDPLHTKPRAPTPEFLHLGDGEARLGHTFLDKQIVDTQGVRVVRVNDLKLATVGAELRLLGADVGAAALFRRMHIEGAARWIARPFRARLEDNVIPWNFVDPLSTSNVQLNVTRGRLREMRPADLADVLEQLPASVRTSALADLSDEQVADTLSETAMHVQRAIFEEMEDDRASDILERMAPDDATDVLQDLNEHRRQAILERMDVEDREALADLLAYDKDTAGGLMTPELVRIPANANVDETIALLRSLEPDSETIFYLYIVDADGRLEGVVSLRSLVTASGDTPVMQLANTRVHTVQVDDDQEQVAEVIARYNLLAMPVVDADGVLKGIVTVDDVIDVLREEASEDVSLISTGTAGRPEEGPVRNAVRRLGWVGMLLIVSCIMGWAMLGSSPVLAGRDLLVVFCFLPLLLEIANAIAFQVSTVVSREIDDPSPGPAATRAITIEVLAGVCLSGLFSALALGGALLIPGFPPALKLVLPGALACAYGYALLCGAVVPRILARLWNDPARGLRPLLVILVSAGGLAIYLGLIRLG